MSTFSHRTLRNCRTEALMVFKWSNFNPSWLRISGTPNRSDPKRKSVSNKTKLVNIKMVFISTLHCNYCKVIQKIKNKLQQ